MTSLNIPGLLSPLLILGAMLLYSVIHSALAWPTVKAQLRRWSGPSFDRWYRLVYNLFAVISLLPVLALTALLPDRWLYSLTSPWMILSLIGQALAVILLVVGLLQTGALSFLGLRQLYQPSRANQPNELIREGLYRWVRHPLYTAGLIFIWLIPVMTLNLLALNVGITIYLVLGARIEERKLLREYGQEYADYRSRTSMLIPGLF